LVAKRGGQWVKEGARQTDRPERRGKGVEDLLEIWCAVLIPRIQVRAGQIVQGMVSEKGPQYSRAKEGGDGPQG